MEQKPSENTPNPATTEAAAPSSASTALEPASVTPAEISTAASAEAAVAGSATPDSAGGHAASADSHGETKAGGGIKDKLKGALKLSAFKAFWKDLFFALISPDRPTRRAALLFFSSLVGLLLVTVVGIKHYRHLKANVVHEPTEEELHAKAQEALNEKKLAEEKIQKSTLDLGRFMVELADSPSGRRKLPMAEFELVIRCNEVEVRDYIEVRTAQARNEIGSGLIGSKREDFLTPLGKRATRRKILLSLNAWLAREYPGAKVDEIYMPNLLVN